MRTSPEVEARILADRREHRRGQDWLGPELGVPARTVSRILRRHDVVRLAERDPLTGQVIQASKTTAVRYERDRPVRPCRGIAQEQPAPVTAEGLSPTVRRSPRERRRLRDQSP